MHAKIEESPKTRGPGRPRLAVKRSHKVQVCLTPAELARVRELCGQECLSTRARRLLLADASESATGRFAAGVGHEH